MIPTLLIHPDQNARQTKIDQILKTNGFSQNHPDLLFLKAEEKLGIETIRKIREFLSLKPYQAKNHALVLLVAENLTLDAQNALLKTLEEPTGEAMIILGAASEEQLLPTIISRCHVVNLHSDNNNQNISGAKQDKWQQKIEELLNSDTPKRFQFIEKLTEKEEFLTFLTIYFRKKLLENPSKDARQFMATLIEGERWAKQNVNTRAILEFLMLKLPKI